MLNVTMPLDPPLVNFFHISEQCRLAILYGGLSSSVYLMYFPQASENAITQHLVWRPLSLSLELCYSGLEVPAMNIKLGDF